MTAPTAALAVNPADEVIGFGPLTVRFLLTGDHSTGSIAAFELTVVAGQRLPAPAHSHDHYEETIYGLSGVLTWTVDGRAHAVGPGQALCIPRGAVHRFDNLGGEDAKALCVITPAAIGPQYFREAFEALRSAAGGPPDRAKIAEIMRRHGLTPAPPAQEPTSVAVGRALSGSPRAPDNVRATQRQALLWPAPKCRFSFLLTGQCALRIEH